MPAAMRSSCWPRARAMLAAACIAGVGCALSSGCTVGQGTGEVHMTVTIPACDLDGDVLELDPTFFAAQAAESSTLIRVQRGGEIERVSDGVQIRVADATDVVRNRLGTPLDVGISDDPLVPAHPVSASIYLNATCTELGSASLAAMSGTVTFQSLYAPKADGDQRLIEGQLSLTLSDPERPDTVHATAEGWFRFFYARGRPAQAFP